MKLICKCMLLIVSISLYAPVYVAQTSKNPSPNKLAKQDLSDLKVWVGKYPLDPKGNFQNRKYANFFAVPKIKTRLVKLLGLTLYRRLVKSDFTGQEPIELIDDYLVLTGMKRIYNDPQANVKYTQVVFSLKGGEVFITTLQGEKISGASNSETVLPWAIEDKIMKYHPKYDQIKKPS